MNNYEKFVWLLKAFLANCTEKQREIISYRWGIPDGKIRTMEEVGELVGLSRQRVDQLEKEAMAKFKKVEKSLTAENL